MKANQINDKLMLILQDNKDCDFGMGRDFRYIKIVNGFRYLCPVSGYDDLAPLIELTTRIGETGIYTSHQLIGYSLTSGTTGVPRYIPCTQKHVEDYKKEFLDIVENERTMLLLESLPRNRKFTDDVYLDSISGIMLQSLKKKFKQLNIVNPEPLVYINEDIDSEYLRAFFALKDASITQIFAPFCWGVVNFFDVIRNNWDTLLNDIGKGSIDPSVKMPEELRNKLEEYIKPEAKRAEELRALYNGEFFAGAWVEKVWPKMKRVIAGGSGSFSIYARRMKRHLGNIVHNNGLYAASEGVIGRALKDGSDIYTLADNSLFLEFLPVNGGSVEPLLADELEKGRDYRVIVTNNSGLYRYQMGDVIRVTDNKDGVPEFKIAYREAQTVTICDTLITEEDIFEAVCAIEDKTGIAVADYTFGAEDDMCRIFLEPEEDADNMKRFSDVSLDEITETVQRSLQKKNTVIKCRILISEPQTQLLYRDQRRYREITALDQIKPVRLLD
ncbi:MAG: GH3 auxin-responsive promoter family protein, partial [Lachnospiraceae bacterium]|nr:GH3 auxin-responsive promoter family protein [Lachnospiraceae bacterium]